MNPNRTRSWPALRWGVLAVAVAILTSGCIYGDEEPDSPHLPLDQVWNQANAYLHTVAPERSLPNAAPTAPDKLNPYILGCSRRGGAAIPETYGPPWLLELRDYISEPTPSDYADINTRFDALLNQGFTEKPPRPTAEPEARTLTNGDYIAMISPLQQGTQPYAEISITSPCFRFDGDTNKDYE